MSGRATVRELIESPEATVGIFALLLNFPWEMLQAPLFADMRSSPHATATMACLQATFGDMVIMLTAYAVVAIRTQDRRWMMAASGLQLMAFLSVGLSITVLIEWLATRGFWVSKWTYAATMPLLPGTGIGLVPMLQWLVLPLLTVWFTRRQLSGSTMG
ncbi:MAG: hypothetical protein H7Z19_07695 [Chitinophagaceae bacterium]|nr:hypothetical protein [Rubrivivax sp.]